MTERAFTNDEIAELEGLRASIKAIDDAPVERYRAALTVLRGDPAQSVALSSVSADLFDVAMRTLREEAPTLSETTIEYIARTIICRTRPGTGNNPATPQVTIAGSEPVAWQDVRKTVAAEWGSHVCFREPAGFHRTCDEDKHCRCADIAQAVVRHHYAAPPAQAGMREALEPEAHARLQAMADCHIVDSTALDAYGRFEATYGDIRKALAALQSPSHSGQRGGGITPASLALALASEREKRVEGQHSDVLPIYLVGFDDATEAALAACAPSPGATETDGGR